MTKQVKISLLVVAILLLVTPLIFYTVNFFKYPLSQDPEIWGHFGDYLNGTFMPMIALVGVIVTLLLGFISEERNLSNVKIEQQKQRPLLHINYFDGEEDINIYMVNKGNGPLIISNYKLVDLKTGHECESVFACLPSIDRNFDNYSGNQKNTVLSVGDQVNLLSYKLAKSEGAGVFEKGREKIRKALSKYKIVVEFHDVYDNKMPTYERSLEWFGRH